MKFGKQMQKRQLDIPEYGTSFVNYKALKKLIKQLSATPVLLAQNASHAPQEVLDPQAALQANKATFFFRLERELEKVNAFYLQKEAELKLRLKTLLDKKKVMQSKSTTASKVSASFITLEEGFQQFGNDLNKLQQFVEINATAFSKILKKWDKTSKSRTKELYLSRAVEVQPCFNRDIISDLSDQATTSLLELGAWAEGEKIDYNAHRLGDHTVGTQAIGTEESDTDSQLLQAANAGNLVALKDWTTRLSSSPDAKGRFTKAFLAGSAEAPIDALETLLATGMVDIDAEDEINERNCLHEAAIYGREDVLKIGLLRGVDAARMDVYGRLPIHYACMHGQVSMVQVLIEKNPETINSLDHDNYTPLIHGIVHHQLKCVEQLLSHGARIDPETENDHAPLNLACQYGSIDITQLLLNKGAKVLPDAEGLYPQHLVARQGMNPKILLLLEEYGASLDQRDKLYQWTPLFHAASEGWVECVKVLLDKGVDVNILDEKDLSAMYYAAWEGHLECMKLLSAVGDPSSMTRSMLLSHQVVGPAASSSLSDSMAMDSDGIPDLSLPPPIIPLRRYGHNFLDTKAFIQLTFDSDGSDAIVFYNDSKYPAARLTISSKSSDYIPRNVMLPIQEEFKTVNFQVDNLDTFTVDFDIYPTFGSKVIARTVALASTFGAVNSSSGQCSVPLFDPRLRAIGQVKFKFQVIKPFRGIPLEIAQFETYWKATSQFDTHPSTLITGSSLSGEYVQIFVQLTSDGVPVLCPRWTLDLQGIQCVVGRLNLREFLSFPGGRGKECLSQLAGKTADNLAEIHHMLSNSLLTLRDVLATLSRDIHVVIQVLYPSAAEERVLGHGPSLNINNFADAILKDVFDHARSVRQKTPDFMRSIVFASHNPDISTALNWKQPNYPVLLCNDLDIYQENDGIASAGPTSTSPVEGRQSSGHSSISVKEAVRIAQSNNFMGLICTSRLLKMVPALVESIKVAGLVLVSDTTSETQDDTSSTSNQQQQQQQMQQSLHSLQSAQYSMGSYYADRIDGVDGVLRGNGVLRFNETIDM